MENSQNNSFYDCTKSLCDCFLSFFPVNVVMKGSHGFISVTEWPLMIVSRSSDELKSIFEMETILKTRICRKFALNIPNTYVF